MSGAFPVGESLPAGWVAPPRPQKAAIEGRYVTLEPLEYHHFEALFKVLVEETPIEHWTYLPYGPFVCHEEMQQCMNQVASGNIIFFAIVNKAKEPLGWISYMRIEESTACLEIGHLCFSSRLQKSREATESVFLLLSRAFELGYRRVEWKCDALNAPSIAAAKRYGFTPEGLFRQATIYKGRNRDTQWFAIIDKEWPPLLDCFQHWLHPENFDEKCGQILSLSGLMAAHRPADPSKRGYCAELTCCSFLPCARHGTEFVLTGFGPFAGVQTNPTTALMGALPTYLQQHAPSLPVNSCTVLETSAEGSLCQLAELRCGTNAMRIHFGVDAGSDGFKLERTAYNEASFGAADERGWRPMRQAIKPSGSKELHTALDLDRLQHRLCLRARAHCKWRASTLGISSDPGRFVCNWVYYNSLHQGVPTLFVHVPPFDACSQAEQLAFVHDLLSELAMPA